MGACVKVGSKKSTCLYIDREVLETAKRVGLNASRVSENALVEAIRRLGGLLFPANVYSVSPVF